MTDDTASPPAPSRLTALRQAPLGHGLLLALFCLATALILSLVDQATRAPIARRATEDLTASLAQVVPDDRHDNDLTTRTRRIDDSAEGTKTVYQATANGTVTGVAFRMTGAGYAGPVEVLLGVAPDGTLLGVRVLSHAETPGLGDKVDVAISDWILGFTGLSLSQPAPADWKVRRDGGVFDQFSGATITPRAVVDAVRRGLEFHARHADALGQLQQGDD
ncbi:electron transport complex subunit RsxG [Actibacterium ureilyticum]|uniref:electron transport complex subunit RsxG n=1 Tax=Actibacterium ureilyticum TaxID=1590614 RepID=UPI000BAAA178|nr:electron transport complex subunit RsxG [Actibacterium ureilyticum]